MIPMADLIDAATAVTGITKAEIIGKGRMADVLLARKAISYLGREGGLSYSRMGKMMGGRDHSTIINQLYGADWLIRRDADFVELVAKIRSTALEIMEARRQKFAAMLAA